MKKYNFLLIIAIFILILNGCKEDFLETKSTQEIDQSIIFENTKNAMTAVNGLHKLMWTSDLSSTAFYGGYDMLMIWYDMMGEDLVYTYYNAQFQSQAKWTGHRNITAGSLLHFYRLLQYFISNADMIMLNIDDAEGPENEKNNIKGQALFYRAFGYFTMAQMYGERYKAEGNNTQLGVVMRNDVYDFDPKPRASVEEVYAQVNKDLDESIHYLSATTVTRPNKSHINIHVARGLKARVLLTQSKWLEAAEMAKLVVEQSGAKLQNDTYTAADRFSNQANTEWLWGSKPLLAQSKQLTHFHGYMSNENVSYNQNSPRAIYNLLYNRITDTDMRKKIWFPRAIVPAETPRPNIPPSTNSKYANYMANKFIVTDPATIGGRDIPFMRLPEMMLVMAEGYARAGRDADAQNALYPLAYHRDPQYIKSIKTGEDLIDEVMFQRRVELWGEGFRYLDLKRLNMSLDRGTAPRAGYNQGRWGNTITTMPANQDPEASNWNRYGTDASSDLGEANRYKAAGIKEWQWLLPTREIDENPLCVQNPL